MTTLLRLKLCATFDSLVARRCFRWSTRCVSVYRASEPSTPLHSASLGIKPAILIPHYDADSCTLFLTGRVSARRVCSLVLRGILFNLTSVHVHVFG